MSDRLIALGTTLIVAAAVFGCGCVDAPSPPGEATQTTEATRRPPDIVAPPPFDAASRPYKLAGPLVPAAATMVSAWDIPRNPMTDPSLEGDSQGAAVRRGYLIFVDTPGKAPRLTPSQMSCSNCHLNAGQRELALPLVGAAGMFPEYNRRAGRDFSLEDRIVGCFLRSENATARRATPGNKGDGIPAPDTEEVLSLAAYIRWLSVGYVPGQAPTWRKQNTIPDDNLLPIDELDPRRGELLYAEHCVACHGEDGQGVQIADKRAGPLWGPGSWNDGAGAARVYTLAGVIRYMMPYLDPGVLNDDEAQHLAAFITSKPRPEYPHKADDYRTESLPVDAVYYRRPGRE